MEHLSRRQLAMVVLGAIALGIVFSLSIVPAVVPPDYARPVAVALGAILVPVLGKIVDHLINVGA